MVSTLSHLLSLIFYTVNIFNLAGIISNDIYSSFADAIERESNLTSVEIIPLFDNYDQSINESLINDIFKITKTFEFACGNNRYDEEKQIDIEDIYNSQNKIMNKIL